MNLRDALKKPEAPCSPNRRSKLADWWFDRRPRFPAWDVTVYENGEAVLTCYQVSFFKARTIERELPKAHAYSIITTSREYSWRR